jgi:hypothetical protein
MRAPDHYRYMAHFRPGSLAQSMLALTFLAVLPARPADSGGRVEYIGGTVAGLAARSEGRLYTVDSEALVYVSRNYRMRVPYPEINLLEYGQQASRRILPAILVSPILLLSKSRKHFLTIGFKDEEGQQQALVLQVHKNDVRALIAGIEARTGLKVDYTDEEARKSGGG